MPGRWVWSVSLPALVLGLFAIQNPALRSSADENAPGNKAAVSGKPAASLPDGAQPRDGAQAATSTLRRPVALAFVDNGRRLLVANRGTGSISVIDPDQKRVVAEHAIGRQLSDLIPLENGNDKYFVATDEEQHQILLLKRDEADISVIERLGVAPYPVSVRCSADGYCVVASLWSRRLTVVRVNLGETAPTRAGEKAPTQLAVERIIDLPFAPRMQLWIPRGERLLVADSFGGNLALVDPAAGKVESVRTLPAHNIRGLALYPSGESLLVSHQTLSKLARTTFEDLHWGNLMTNVAHSLTVDAVLDPNADLLLGSRTLRLGEVGRAAGDPAGIAFLPDKRTVVAYAGVDEVAVVEEGRPWQLRIAVGACPTAIAVHPRRSATVYVANTLDDSISVIDLADNEPQKSVVRIPLAAPAEPTLADQGEVLFHSAKLSHDGWISCQSCHTDGHSNGLLNDNQGDGSFDAPKRVLSLLGVAGTEPLAWNGNAPDLEGQIRKSVRTTMHGPGFASDLTEQQVAVLAAYLRTLAPPPPLGTLVGEADAAAIDRGRAVFERLDCRRCHAPPTYTSAGAYDVGLEDEVGKTKFNPPSLRGVSQRDTLFHDNRARSLDDVFSKHRHQVPDDFSDRDRADLITFLRSL